LVSLVFFFFFQAADGIRDFHVTGVQTCALPISPECSIPPSVYCCLPCSPPAPWPCPVSSCSATPCACGALERAGSSQWRSAPALPHPPIKLLLDVPGRGVAAHPGRILPEASPIGACAGLRFY